MTIFSLLLFLLHCQTIFTKENSTFVNTILHKNTSMIILLTYVVNSGWKLEGDFQIQENSINLVSATAYQRGWVGQNKVRI